MTKASKWVEEVLARSRAQAAPASPLHGVWDAPSPYPSSVSMLMQQPPVPMRNAQMAAPRFEDLQQNEEQFFADQAANEAIDEYSPIDPGESNWAGWLDFPAATVRDALTGVGDIAGEYLMGDAGAQARNERRFRGANEASSDLISDEGFIENIINDYDAAQAQAQASGQEMPSPFSLENIWFGPSRYAREQRGEGARQDVLAGYAERGAELAWDRGDDIESRSLGLTGRMAREDETEALGNDFANSAAGALEFMPGVGLIDLGVGAGTMAARNALRGVGREIPEMLAQRAPEAAGPLTREWRGEYRDPALMAGGAGLGAELLDGEFGDDPLLSAAAGGLIVGGARNALRGVDLSSVLGGVSRETAESAARGVDDIAEAPMPSPLENAGEWRTNSPLFHATDANIDGPLRPTRRAAVGTPRPGPDDVLAGVGAGALLGGTAGYLATPEDAEASSGDDGGNAAAAMGALGGIVGGAAGARAGRSRLVAAIRDPETGQIYRGANHAEAVYSAPDDVIPRLEQVYAEEGANVGFAQGDQFMTRDEALASLGDAAYGTAHPPRGDALNEVNVNLANAERTALEAGINADDVLEGVGTRPAYGEAREAVVRAIEQAVEDGESITSAEIARRTGLALSTVNSHRSTTRNGANRNLRDRLISAEERMGDLRSEATSNTPRKQELRRMAEEGMTMGEAASALGISTQAVNKMALTEGIQFTHVAVSDETVARNAGWLADHSGGMTFRQIAERDGVGVGKVSGGIARARNYDPEVLASVRGASSSTEEVAARLDLPEDRVRAVSAVNTDARSRTRSRQASGGLRTLHQADTTRTDLPRTGYHATLANVEGPLSESTSGSLGGGGAYHSSDPDIINALIRNEDGSYPEGANIVPERLPDLNRYVPLETLEEELIQTAMRRGIDIDDADAVLSLQNEIADRYKKQGMVGISNPDYAGGRGETITWDASNRRAPWARMSERNRKSSDPLAGIAIAGGLTGAAALAGVGEADAQEVLRDGRGLEPLPQGADLREGSWLGPWSDTALADGTPAVIRTIELPNGQAYTVVGLQSASGEIDFIGTVAPQEEPEPASGSIVADPITEPYRGSIEMEHGEEWRPEPLDPTARIGLGALAGLIGRGVGSRYLGARGLFREGLTVAPAMAVDAMTGGDPYEAGAVGLGATGLARLPALGRSMLDGVGEVRGYAPRGIDFDTRYRARNIDDASEGMNAAPPLSEQALRGVEIQRRIARDAANESYLPPNTLDMRVIGSNTSPTPIGESFFDPTTGKPIFGSPPRTREPVARPPLQERAVENGATGALQGVPASTLRTIAGDLDIETKGVTAAQLRRTLARSLGREFDSTRDMVAFLRRYGVLGTAIGVGVSVSADNPLEGVGAN